ncbi:hypothetical protein SynBIOSE41_02309 [Synechococcus sp. BIOS-E4-1]|nr:hypothetical protein SynBIOSE41_02309 [Synechococcus sp. BIOS-E4-1]
MVMTSGNKAVKHSKRSHGTRHQELEQNQGREHPAITSELKDVTQETREVQ